MQLVLDTVQGSQAVISVYNGRISRMGVILGAPIGFLLGSPSTIVSGLAASGMPQVGDRYPDPAYQDYRCKTHIFRGMSGEGVIGCEILYEWPGPLIIKDTSTLSADSRQIHPNGQPLLISWKNPNDATEVITKVATMAVPMPMRHVVISQTVDYVASESVLSSYPSVNFGTWYGLPSGFWMWSGLEAETLDNGITRTYTVTLSSKVVEDWSQYEFMRDDRGNIVYVNPTAMETLRNKDYVYGIDSTLNGVLKVGMLPTVDFASVLGVS